MIIYFDGGYYSKTNPYTNKSTNTYGILFHIGESDPIEKFGFYPAPINMIGYHEEIAFVEAFCLIRELNKDYKNITFYTDNEIIANGNFILHDNNYKKTKKENFLNRIDLVLKFLNKSELKTEIIDCLLNSRFQKIKAHKNTVDNLRVDYLAKMENLTSDNKMSYQNFLACSFERFNEYGKPIITNLPFMPDNNSRKIRV